MVSADIEKQVTDSAAGKNSERFHVKSIIKLTKK